MTDVIKDQLFHSLSNEISIRERLLNKLSHEIIEYCKHNYEKILNDQITSTNITFNLLYPFLQKNLFLKITDKEEILMKKNEKI